MRTDNHTTPTRPILRFHGGKWRLAPWIIKHFPEHVTYVEPYGGAASVLLRKRPSEIEIYNDLSSEVWNFFRVLRDETDELVRRLRLTPWSRQEYQLSYQETPDKIEQARRFFVRSWQGVGGVKAKNKRGWRYVSSGRDRSIPKRFMGLDDLYDVAERFMEVTLECDDALRVIARFDSPETLFYVDPPYVLSTRSTSHRNAYRFEMTDYEHVALARCLHTSAGAVVLSGYDNRIYSELFRTWHSVYKRTRTAAAHTTRTEVLWLNPRCVEMQHERLAKQELL